MDRFPEHVFISYAHRDNQPIANDKGWVTQFDEALRTYLGQRLGVDPVVWRDSRLQGNTALTPEIEAGLASSALLITVLSPSYVNSEWCRRELEEFCEHAELSGGLLVDHKSRVFKVVKLPPESLEILPNSLRDVLDYQFYRKAKDGGDSFELDPARGEEDRQLFVQAVARVAADAARLIKELKTSPVPEVTAAATRDLAPPNAKDIPIRIFLADCTSDRREEKERLLADLKLSGYTVLPDRALPVDSEAEYCEAVLGMLQSCHVSIHLVGSRYGTVPDAEGPSQKSVVALQNEIAAERSVSGALRRVIWLPADTQPQSDRQRSFIDLLHNDASAQAGADLVSGDFEELRTTVHRLIKARQEALAAPPGVAQELQEPSIRMGYLVCTEEDLKSTLPLRKWLKQQGIELELPLFDGDAQALRNSNQDLIRRCSGLLLFYGAGEEAWFRAVRSDHRKISTYRVGLPPVPRYIYLAEPDNPMKQDLVDMEEPGLIDGRQGFNASLLTPFFQAMGTVRGEP
jgi:hypothetical protein